MTDFAKLSGDIWLDGEWLPWQEAKIHVLTHTLHYGMGIYEGIRAYETADNSGSALFRMPDHIRRFHESAKLIQMHMPYDEATLRDVCVQIVKRNGNRSCYVRPLAFFGSEGMGLHAENLQTHIMVASWPWGAYLGDGLMNGVRIKTSTIRRIAGNSLMTKAKVNGHYVNSMMALKEAQNCGFDEALMLDQHGFVAEGSGENFFIIKDEVIYTPNTHSILLGITRATIMQIAQDFGYKVVEKDITIDQTYIADEAFFTGTAAEVTPIREIDSRQLGDGKVGPITKKLQQAYFDTVKGERAEYSEWLTIIS